jgi:4-amino-4-deoxy-L-arabinose transferase-like glycosyltransferase
MINNQGLTGRIYQEHYSIKLGDRNFSLSTKMILIAIAVVAVSLRLFSAFYQGNDVSDLPGIFDQISYDGLARRVADGYGFSFAEGHWPATRAGEPTAHWSYLYTLYLATVYKVFGTYPLIARAIQALIAGIFQTFLIWRLGKHLFGQTVGLTAAALNAVYIYFFYYAGALITETFYITCILWTFDVSFRLVHREAKSPGWILWLELGLAIGLTVLLRQVFLLFLPFLFIWIWWNVRVQENARWNQVLRWVSVRGLLVTTAVLGLMILPFTIRNYRAFGTFVLLNTNAGFAFYWGNHPIHGTHFLPLLPGSGPSYQDLIPDHLLSLNEGMLDKALLKEGIRIVLNDPVRYLLLSLSRIEEYIKFWPSQDSGTLSNLSRVGSFGILLPFILYGTRISFSYLRKPAYAGQTADLLIIYLFVISYAAIHLLTWTLIRYRLPIDACLILFAAVGIDGLSKRSGLPFRKITGRR